MYFFQSNDFNRVYNYVPDYGSFMYVVFRSQDNVAEYTAQHYHASKNITTPQDAIDYFHSLKYHIQALDTTISKWWLPWLGFSNDMDPLRDLKQQYVSTFRKYQLEPLMDQFMNRLRKHQSKRSAVTDSDEAFHLITGQLMGTLVYYADFLNQFIRSRHKDSFQFQPIAYQNGKGIFENPVSNEKFMQFMACYTHALIWAKNRRPFRKDFYQFQTSIEEMVALMPDLMEWTLPVVNDQVQGINLLSLWINDLETNDPDSFMNAAYTKKGFDYIQNFFSVIRQAHSTPATFDERKKAFNKIYTTNYLQKWEQAAKAFSNCSTYLETRSAWADTLASLYDIHKNPYFQMIALIVDHTRSFHENRKKWPKWLQFSHRLHEQTVLANANLSLTEVSSSSAINSEAANAFNGYLAALKDIAQLPNTPGVSYKIIKTLFSDSETFCPGDGPDTMACLSIFQLQSIWEKRNDQNAAFWDLYEGPMTLIRQFSMRETACQLQQTWENYVLSVDLQSSSLVRQQKAGMQKFIQSEASHFLEKITQTRYAPKRLAGLIVPFRDSFFKYVAYHPKPQELKDRYPVIIKATPSRTNPQAESQPQLTLIKMKCNQNQQILVIGHQPAQETFYWSESCGPVHITFHLNDLKLTRSYPNPMAFPKFVRDVQYGSKRFHQSEFVLQKARLKSLHVDYVELKLQLFGHETIAKAQKRGFMTAPEKITYCWETTAPQVVRDETVEKKEAQEKADLAEKPESDIEKQDIEKQDIEKQDTERPEIEKSPEVSSREHVYITILASFRSDANAIKKAKQLTQDGLNSAVYWLKDDNENLWYIVVSGIYADYDQAMGAVNEIKTNYSIMPFVKKMAHATIKKRRVNIIF
ncbi:MAG: hypothetical protein OMM_01876 [Candidatus Magnetoglobus multicellularis str. Araruama]|uniref:SPOR domain-containing protein n=1 Tax=Candidatus Magnetoglobus multicellularis str. Araruama TaxID=890399 RepID=A0A1V1PBR0_9BACT|nr:MAG: hypothetical protein OMM_01876 [Candidatus Magnetoglobus multicellularis str. Araruama]